LVYPPFTLTIAESRFAALRAWPAFREKAMQAKFTYAIRFTDDMAATAAFYRDVLGLPVRFETPFWTEFDTGQVTLALHPASADNPAGGVQLGFRTDDVVRLHAEAARNGLTFSAPPREEHGTHLARVRDADGVEISLSS